jgi:diamine N-acetyltransferase
MDPRTRAFAREYLQNRAAEDSAFRAALLADPRTAIKEAFGMELPPEYEVQAVEETPTRLCLVLPLPTPSRDSEVSLREVTARNVNSVCNLEVKESQSDFVANNAFSLAQMHFEPKAWARAVYAGDTPVGFVMLKDDPEEQRYYVWRFMIAGEYQGLGFGRRAMEQVTEYVRSRPGATELTLSYVPGEGSPREFYMRLGFHDTGVKHGPENEMKLVL